MDNLKLTVKNFKYNASNPACLLNFLNYILGKLQNKKVIIVLPEDCEDFPNPDSTDPVLGGTKYQNIQPTLTENKLLKLLLLAGK